MKKLLFKIKRKFVKKKTKDEILEIFNNIENDLKGASTKLEMEIDNKSTCLSFINFMRERIHEFRKGLQDEIIKSERNSTSCTRTKRRSKKR